MDRTRFEYHVSLVPGARFAPAVHALVVHTARYAGCASACAAGLADTVMTLVAGLGGGGATEVACRRRGGPLEITIAGDGPDTFTPRPGAGGAQVACRREGDRWVCTVTMTL